MKLCIAAILMIVTLGMFSLSQGAQTPLDIKKSKEEMEIMRGILNTTLTFYAENAQKSSARGRFSGINSFYLAGQGAVFEIPTHGLLGSSADSSFKVSTDLFGPMFDQEISMRALEAEVKALEASQESMKLFASGQARDEDDDDDDETLAPPAVPAPPAPPAPAVTTDKSVKAARAQKKLEDARKKMEAARANLEKRQEAQTAKYQKFLQALSEVRVPLVDALANYGDSMTTVKPDEYVNLVLITESYSSYPRRVDVISARKSWIADYKAGRLTLDAFRQKVLQYNQ